MANLADFDTKISSLAHQIAEAERQLWALQATHRDTVEARSKAIEKGEVTTGDNIRDLVIRLKGASDIELEKRLKIVESKISSKKGELALFTYAQDEISWQRKGGPGNSAEGRHIVWYVACGVLADDTLRIEKNKIVFPIDRYAVSLYSWMHLSEMQFKIRKDPFTRERRYDEKDLVYAIDAYAHPEDDVYRSLKLVVGDKEVEAFLASHKRFKDSFENVCALLSHLILQPTD